MAGPQPPNGSIELPANYIHHTVIFLPNGNFVVLDAEQRRYEDWHTSVTDRTAPRRAAMIVGDVIKEITRESKLVHEYRLLDMLDPYRVGHGSMDGYWRKLGFPDAYDWSHANAVGYDPSDECFIVSLRHQDCIVKFRRSDGAIRWLLGNHSEWRDPWRSFLLAPQGDVRWQFHQHDCSVVGANRILCFDNGNYRVGAFAEPAPHENNFSRAVESEIDGARRTVRQVWEYGEAVVPRIYASYQGGASRLPRTGNTLITFGGICSRDGVPAGTNVGTFGRARILEVTPNKEVVFDLAIDDSSSPQPTAYSAFRADHHE